MALRDGGRCRGSPGGIINRDGGLDKGIIEYFNSRQGCTYKEQTAEQPRVDVAMFHLNIADIDLLLSIDEPALT